MTLRVFETYEQLSQHAADQIVSTVINKPDASLCLAGGDSPLRTYELVVQKFIEKKIDYSRVHFVGLDEWVGVPPEDTGSCQFFLRKNILEPLKIKKSHTHLFNAMSANTKAECDTMDKRIADLGGIDLMLVGIGMNGHIGFNEPGVSSMLQSHVIELDEVTQKVGQKYFSRTMTLKQGITLGLRHLLESRSAILLANGVRKSDIMKRMLEEPVHENIPASFMQEHRNGFVFLDREAASKLSAPI